MKKILFSFVALLPAFAFAEDKRNNISMVTYFPVPYVSYSQVEVNQQMDVGLTANNCQLELGSADSGNCPLEIKTAGGAAGALNVSGETTLNLESAPGTQATWELNSLSVGESGRSGATLDFNSKVYIPAITGAISSNSQELYVAGNLYLFGTGSDTTKKQFPSCYAVTASDNTISASNKGKMKWESLSLGKSTDKKIYLTCGGVNGCDGTPPSPTTEACSAADAIARFNSDKSFANTHLDYFLYNEVGWWIFARKVAYALANNVRVCGNVTVTHTTCTDEGGSWHWGDDRDVSSCEVYSTIPTVTQGECSEVLSGYSGTVTYTTGTNCSAGALVGTFQQDLSGCVHWVSVPSYSDCISAGPNGVCPGVKTGLDTPSCNGVGDVGNNYVSSYWSRRIPAAAGWRYRCCPTISTCTAYPN